MDGWYKYRDNKISLFLEAETISLSKSNYASSLLVLSFLRCIHDANEEST